jgi:hypothetical protein
MSTQKSNFETRIKIPFFHVLKVQNTSAKFDFAVLQHDLILKLIFTNTIF